MNFFFFRFHSFLVGVDAYNVGGYYYSMAFKLVKNEIQLSRRLGGREQRSDGAVACSFTNAAESATNLQHSCSRVLPTGGTDDPIDRDHSITGADELLLLRMLIIV